MVRVLILGGGLQALSVSRSLYECDYEIVVVASKKEAINYSRYVSFIVEKSELWKEENAINTLNSIILRYQCTVVISMSDIYAEFLSLNKVDIEKKTSAKCAIDEYSKFEIAYSKRNLLKLCEQHSIPHPKTCSLTADNLQFVSKYVGFPALIKPNYSVGARGITLVNDFEELKQKYEKVTKIYGPSTLQSYIEHNGHPYYNVMLYRDCLGNIIASTVLEIRRYYPIKGGSSSLGVTIENQQLESMCNQVLEALNWHGFADFDVLRDEEGHFLIIEMNPRVPASLRAAAVSGINFPEIIVNDCLGLPQKKYQYSPGKELRYLGLDIMWFIASGKRFTTYPSWFRFFGKDVYYQEGGIGDIKAMCASLWEGIRKMASTKFRKSKSGI